MSGSAAAALALVAAAGPAVWSSRVTASSGVTRSQNQDYVVDVLFIRHGHGCHNVLLEGSVDGNAFHYGAGMKAGINFRDPPLTDCGVQNTQRNGQQLREALSRELWAPDFVGTSSLLRAMETGLLMFPEHRVAPLPLLGEFTPAKLRALGCIFGCVFRESRCNVPEQHHAQRDTLFGWPAKPPSAEDRPLQGRARGPELHLCRGQNASRVDWRYVEGEALEIRRAKRQRWGMAKARGASSYLDFRAFLGQRVLPALIREGRGGGARTLRVALVSHFHFLHDALKEHFGCHAGLQNNEATLVQYWYDSTSEELSEMWTTAGEACPNPLGTETITAQWRQKYACPQDYERCVKWDAQRMGLAEYEGSPQQSPWIKKHPVGQQCCTDR